MKDMNLIEMAWQIKTESTMEIVEIVNKIFRACYYSADSREAKMLQRIVSDAELSALEKANEICEYLEIPKRGNRTAIKAILEGKNQN